MEKQWVINKNDYLGVHKMFRNKKILLLVTMLLMLSMTLVACSTPDGDNDTGNDTGTVGDNGSSPSEDNEVKTLEEAFAEEPILLTSIGQSADMDMVKTLMGNAGIDYEVDKEVKASDLSDEKTLILAVGGSSKGLGAAGINADDEIARAKELVKEAKDKDIKLIAMHIGGKNRRGELSDKFIEPSVSVSDYIIVVESGNEDGLFTNIALENDIPMESVSSIADAIEPLKKAFK